MECDPNRLNPQVDLYQTTMGIYACIAQFSVDFGYSVKPSSLSSNFFSVQRILFPDHIDPSISTKRTYSLDTDISWIVYIKNNIELHVENIYKIAPRLGWQPTGKGIQCCSNFKNWIIEENKQGYTELNLSGLGLTLVPMQIGLFSDLRKLDLSNNQLRILPVELQKLNKLVFVDLRNNPIIELPDWLEGEKNIEVMSDIIKSNPDTWAQS